MRFVSILVVVLCAAAACNGAPASLKAEKQMTRNFPHDVDIYGWHDYLDQISATISDVIDQAKQKGEDLWNGLQEAGNKIIQKAKESLVSSEDAATAFLNDVYPTLIEKLSDVVDFGKDELKFIGDLVVSFLKDFGQEAVRLGIKYFEEHQDEIIKEIKTEAKIFLRTYILKKLKDYWVGTALKREVSIHYGWSDFWAKVGQAINNAVEKVKSTGEKLADKVSEEFDKLKDQVNQIMAPVKEKVKIIMQEVMPILAEKAKFIIKDAKRLAREVGLATLELLKKLGHDALVEAQKWLDENHELVEKLLYQFLTEQLPKMIKEHISGSSAVAPYNGWTDFWGKVGDAIKSAAQTVKEAGGKFVDKLKVEFKKLADKINEIVAPIKAKVDMFFRNVVPEMLAQAKQIISDAKERAIQVGEATLEAMKNMGHDALIEAQKWLDENHELVEELLFKFLTEVLPKIIQEAIAVGYNGWTDFWEKVGNSINNAVQKVKETGANLADKISDEFNKLKDTVNAIVAPIKTKVQIILADVMPKIAAKAKIIYGDAKELAKQVGSATLGMLKQLGHDALIEAQKWLEANHELVEQLLYKFLTEQLPQMIKDAMASNYAVATPYNGWTDFWKKVGEKIDAAVEKVKETGQNLAEKISNEFDELKDKVNAIIAPIKVKVQIILRDIMPKIAEKAKIVIHDAAELAKQVGAATLAILKKLGHDALIEAQKWLAENHELVEKLLYNFLTEQLPKLIKDSLASSYAVVPYNGWTDFWEKVGNAIDSAVDKVVNTGKSLADKISEEFDKIKEKVNNIIAPIKEKVQIIMRDVMPVIAAKAKVVFQDAKELAKQVGLATLEILKKLGHDALVEGQKWLEENHELVEKLLFEFLTEQLPKLIMESIKSYSVTTYGWSDFWEKVGNAIDNAVDAVKATGEKLADKIADQFNEFKDKVNAIIAPIKTKVQIIMRDVMPKIAEKAKLIIKDAAELAKQVGLATLAILKQLGHDALIEAQKWLSENHELVEKLLFQFLTEQLPKLIKDSLASYSLTTYGWSDFWEKVGNAIEDAVDAVKATGEKLADKIADQFNAFKDQVNAIIAPIKTKVQIVMSDIMPKIAEKAKIVIKDAAELAKQVGLATLAILKQLGHDALIEAQKWLNENHELVEKLLFQFLTEQLPKLIKDSLASYSLTTYGWSDFWEKVGNAIEDAVDAVKATGEKLADKIADQFNEFKDKVNAIIAPIKTKVQIIMRDVMPKIAEKAKLIIKDAAELAKQVGLATLAILKQLGHDALIEAQKWLSENHELVKKLLFEFLTEQLPKLIKDSLASYSLTTYGWSDFWEKVGNAIEDTVDAVKATGEKLADKIADKVNAFKDKVNAIIAPIKTKVQIVMRDIMPKIAEKAKIVIKDAAELAKQVGLATLAILKQLGHDALIEAQKWLDENHELVEKLLFQFLTEQLPKLIKDSLASSYSLTAYGWSDFWGKVGNAIDSAIAKAKEAGKSLAEKISDEFNELKDKINAIVAPIKTKVVMVLRDIMPKIAEKAKLIYGDAKELAKQVGLATLELLKKLGHDSLLFAQKWLAENKDMVEKLIFEFLTEQLPKLIKEGSLKF